MQLYVTLRANEITLPMAYRHLQQAMIYHAVRAYDSEQSEHLHNTGYQTEDRRFKLFTFGPLQGSYSVNSGTITFRGEVRFEIRSADPALLQTLVIAWKPGTAVRLGKNELTVAECRPEHTSIRENRIYIKTVSPIVAYVTREDGSTVFYSPEDEEFCAMIRANAARKWRSFTGRAEAPAFRCVPLALTPFRKQVTMFKDTRINAWHGAFELSGDTQLLELLYNAGLGAKSSQGFGMFALCPK